MFKEASRADLQAVESIMRRIHDEDPSYWPYGLETSQFNGGLYMVQKTASAQPVGFVGWQKFVERGRRVGYYAIGILPEHRRSGFAKQAVAQVLQAMSPSVDEVKALIMPHNAPSKALADSLGVQVIEKAAAGPSGKGAVLGAILNTILFDQAADPHERTLGSSFRPDKWDKDRLLMGGMNAILGAIGGHQIARGGKNVIPGITAIAATPVKDLALKGVGTLGRIDAAAAAATGKLQQPESAAPEGIMKSIPKGAWAGLGGLGLGALGVLAYSAKRKADHRKAMLEEQSKGRVKVTLPTKQPGDSETTLDIPIEEVNLSAALRSRIGRDTRRRLHEETRARTQRRRPRNPQKPTDKEKEDAELAREAEELNKEASSLDSLVAELFPPLRKLAVMGAPPTMPTPPLPGQNPAMRQQQQAATANAMQPAPNQPSTTVNPQIAAAQAAAQQAEVAAQAQVAQMQQQAQAQAAQMEQQAQAAQMEQQQKFQQALSKSESEKETLRLNLEKEKARAELMKEQQKLQSKSVAGGKSKDAYGAEAMTKSRLDRISSRVGSLATKSAAAGPGSDPIAGPLPSPPPLRFLKPNTAQRINDASDTGFLVGPQHHRVSMGKLGDTLFDWFAKKRLYAANPQAPLDYSPNAVALNPDPTGMVEQLYAGGVGAMRSPMLPG